MRPRSITTLAFGCALLLCLSSRASAQIFDLSSGGAPTITGARGGSVRGSASVLNDLTVTINFGEVSPLNSNSIVKVVVPIAIRSLLPYQVTATLTSSSNADPQAVQNSDIGFGINNLRVMGNKAQVCSNHTFRAPFNNDPSSGVTLNGNGRATYPSSLNNVGLSTVLLSGPTLTKINGQNGQRLTNDGYIFDAIFTITPQYYSSGNFSLTITFNIAVGPIVLCT